MFLVLDIGCIECGLPRDIVGVFDDQARAEAIAASCTQNHARLDGGHHRFQVIPLPAINTVHPAYQAVDL